MSGGEGKEDSAARLLALAEVPGPENWAAFGAALRTEPAASTASIRRLRERLSAWPDRFRRVTFSPVAASNASVWRIGPGAEWITYATLSRTLELSTTDAVALGIAAPAFRALAEVARRLEIDGPLDADDDSAVKALLRCVTALKHASTLDLSRASIHGEAVGGADPPFWRAFFRALPDRITDLALDGAPVGTGGASALAASKAARGLYRLRLSGCQIGSRGARALLGWPAHGHLVCVDLGANQISTAAAVALVRAGFLDRLERFSCAGNPIGDEFVRSVAARDHALKLQALDLSRTSVGTDALAAIATSPATANVRDVRLNGCPLGDAAGALIVQEPFSARVAVVDLRDSNITEAFVGEVTARPMPPHLRSLAVTAEAVGARGLEALRRWLPSPEATGVDPPREEAGGWLGETPPDRSFCDGD